MQVALCKIFVMIGKVSEWQNHVSNYVERLELFFIANVIEGENEPQYYTYEHQGKDACTTEQPYYITSKAIGHGVLERIFRSKACDNC
jgi:hypothetical protein